jgi:hypothetical protein
LKAAVGMSNSTEAATRQQTVEARIVQWRRNTHWHVYIGHFRWFIQDDSSKVNETWLRPTSFILLPGLSLSMNGLSTLSLSVTHPKWSSRVNSVNLPSRFQIQNSSDTGLQQQRRHAIAPHGYCWSCCPMSQDGRRTPVSVRRISSTKEPTTNFSILQVWGTPLPRVALAPYLRHWISLLACRTGLTGYLSIKGR